MDRRIQAILTAVLLAVGACSSEQRVDEEVEDRTAYEDLFTTADTSEAYDTDQAAPVTAVQGTGTRSGPLTATGQLEGIADGAPPGSVVITEAGPGTLIQVQIDRYAVGTELKVALARGSCQDPGEILRTLDGTIRIDAQGLGSLQERIDVPAATVLNGEHSLRVTDAGEGPADIILACANLPAA